MQIYTDGGCTGNPGPGGWAAVILDKAGKTHEISGADPQTTNNRMELTAVIRALEHVNTASGPIEVITDSEYVQKGISIWMANWIRKGWKTAAGKPVKNQDLWKQLQEMSTLRPIRWTWVKGHAGNHWNERCDALVEEQRKNMNEKDNLAAILAIFNEINTIPRKSTQLEQIRPWLMKWGKDRGFEVKTDNAGNIVYKVPATPGYESAPTIVLQGHMDMVCEKRSGSDHNFQTDPIISWTDGDWLKARETSLGADNGIALAMFFHIITALDSEHPPLEVLITSDEETGLVGAQNLDPGILSGKILLNLDSEDEGVFTIGCAGGMDVNMVLPVEYSPVPGGYIAMEISIGGLEGGHSGIEIHLGKACANTLLGRVLRTVLEALPEARIGEISGGTAHNALPREARALIALQKDRVPELEKLIARLDADLKQENAALEKNLLVSIRAADLPQAGLFTAETGTGILDAIRLIPHGVRSMSTELDAVVDTSLNFAILRTEGTQVKILTNIRSANKNRGKDFANIMFGLARLYGGSCTTGNHYPAWEPNTHSPLLERSKHIWQEIFAKAAKVEVTHAGLECGAIGAVCPGMDMISFGPSICQPHSPDERLYIPSIDRVYEFLQALLKSYR